MAKFVAILEFSDASERLAIRPTHREYLKSLLDAGKLVASGPFVDDTGALLIYEAADEAEVRAILDADPYTAGGCIANVTLRGWNQVFP